MSAKNDDVMIKKAAKITEKQAKILEKLPGLAKYIRDALWVDDHNWTDAAVVTSLGRLRKRKLVSGSFIEEESATEYALTNDGFWALARFRGIETDDEALKSLGVKLATPVEKPKFTASSKSDEVLTTTRELELLCANLERELMRTAREGSFVKVAPLDLALLISAARRSMKATEWFADYRFVVLGALQKFERKHNQRLNALLTEMGADER